MYNTIIHIQIFLENSLGATLTILIWALILSLISMSIYWLVSPQRQLKKLKLELNAVQEQIKDTALMEENPFEILSKLLTVSLKRVLYTFIPALLATLPVIFFWDFLSSQYESTQGNFEFLSFGPSWIRGWWTVFLLGMITSTMTIKSLFKIE